MARLRRTPTPAPAGYGPLDPGAPRQRGRLRRVGIVAASGAALIVAGVGLRFAAVGLAGGDPGPTGGDTPVAVSPFDADLADTDRSTEWGWAVAAATSFVTRLNDQAIIADETARWEWLGQVATPTAAAEVEAWVRNAVNQAGDRFAALGDGRHAHVRTVPAGYRVDSFAPGERAEVMVWSDHVAVVQGFEPRLWWQTTRLSLAWRDLPGDGEGRWLVTGVEVLPGPDPRTDPAELFAPAAAGFTPYEVTP